MAKAKIWEQSLSKRELSEFFQVSNENIALAVVSLGGTIIKCNEKLGGITKYSVNEIEGAPLSRLAHQADAAAIFDETLANRIRDERIVNVVYKLCKKDGEDLYVNWRFYLLGDPLQAQNTVCFIQDITAETKAKAEQNARAKSIDDAYAIIEFSMDGKVLGANENYCSAVGYPSQELIGRSDRIMTDPKEMSDKVWQDQWDRLRAGEAISGEFKRVRKNGEITYFSGSYSPLFGPDGKPTKVVKLASDNTAQVLERMKTADVSRQVDRRLEEIVDAVAEANQRSAVATEAASQTSSQVQSIADALENLEASTTQIAEAMQHSRGAVSNVMEATKKGDNHIVQLSESADSMTSIVEIIHKVAGQINLLALNAAIEAARAGEAGKGFAVVAAEVKSLADQVEKSINQISGDIDRVQNVSNDVVTALQSIGAAVQSVEESVTLASDAAEEQSQTARDINESMREASASVSDISDNLMRIAESVEGAGGFARDGSQLYRSLTAAAMH